MSAARDEVLARIRTALSDRAAAAPPVPRNYRAAGILDGPELVTLLSDRLLDYKATVHRCSQSGLAAEVAAALVARGVERVVAPDGFPAAALAQLPSSIAVYTDDPVLSTAELDQLDGVLTTCAVAVAETGTIVLDASRGQGRRAVTLVPDYHLLIVRAEQIVETIPQALERLSPTRPLTWISGPSATSDIELSRVEGVHGPRRLEVVIVADE
jgi:L-lactate dehydrogenase complex protein LldG